MSFVHLYIDPATGSMLFSVLLGVFITAGFFLRMLFIKLKTVLGGKSASTTDGHHKFLIYSDDKRYWNTFMPVLDEFEQREIDVGFWTSSEDDPVFSKEYKYVHPEFIGAGNKAFVKLNAARADVLLSTTPGLDVLQWKRSKGVGKYVHIFHAATSALTYRMFGLDFYDVVLTASDFQLEEMRMVEKKRKIAQKEAAVVGLTYFDVLAEKLKKAEKPQKTNKVILLAPSWGKSGFLYKFGDKLIDALIDTGYEIVFRPHPQSFTADKDILEKIRAKYDKCPNFSWNSDNDNFDILNKADLLISDFSGVVFDFTIIFGKPIMYTSVKDFDDSVYDSAWVKKELWKFKVLPTIGCEISEDNLDDLKNRIDATISSDKYDKGIKAARDYAWKNHGHAAEAIVNYISDLQQRISDTAEVK
ncbi:MAG: CDP-glycerol glycerophosphotransferase family protein [Clostridiales bacterium]|nr:CDP-glycerol glycerophosphotransferase family protein [Clostridiales bacterium]